MHPCEGIRQALAPLEWIRTIEWVDEVGSTNTMQRDAIAQRRSPELPWLLVAENQTAGRGRNANTWWSPSGCLTFSLALPLSNCVNSLSQLPLVVGIAVADAIRDWVPIREQVRVKWPNDVFVGSRKVAGVLIESVMSGSDQNYIVGIGINVTVDLTDAPSDVQAKASSLHLVIAETKQRILTAEAILIDTLFALRDTLSQWQTTGDFLSDAWSEFSLLSNCHVKVASGESRYSGLAVGIDGHGGLLIREDSGKIVTVLSGVVEQWSYSK